jgi:hypothetical protein
MRATIPVGWKLPNRSAQESKQQSAHEKAMKEELERCACAKARQLEPAGACSV